MGLRLEHLFLVLQVVEELSDELVLLLDREKLVLLELLELCEFFVEVILQLEDNGLQQFNLTSLPDVSVNLEGLVDDVHDVEDLQFISILLTAFTTLVESVDAVNNLLELLKLEVDFPVHLFHAADLSLLQLILGHHTLVVVHILLLGLGTKLTLRNLQDGDTLASLGGPTSLDVEVLLLLVTLGLLLGILGRKLSRCFLDTLIFTEVRLASGSVHEVAFLEF
mmetsp:Transcript_23105/g.35789  ORF Transcript_23105/g.35789 Transcript_23105/m.35789 type:complete len:223 (+) Transcript_23105:1909-2577(+)